MNPCAFCGLPTGLDARVYPVAACPDCLRDVRDELQAVREFANQTPWLPQPRSDSLSSSASIAKLAEQSGVVRTRPSQD